MSRNVQRVDFESVYDLWQEVLPSCHVNNVFVTPDVQRIWWRHFGRDYELQLLSVSDGDEPLGIAPLMLRDGVLSFVGGDDLFDYHDFLVPRGKEPLFYELVLEHLVRLEWDTLELTSLPDGSPTIEYLPALAEAKGLAAEVTPGEVTPVAVLPGSWEDYLGGLSKKGRHELRRKLRRLQEADNPRQYVCDDADKVAGCMRHFFRLMRASSSDKDEFLNVEREGFFLDLAAELTEKGQFRLYFLDVEGVPVASCICIDYADSYLLYNSGYDPDYSALSVGLLNKALCIREAIEEGKSSFNFLKGDERYKYDLGGRDHAVHHLRLRR